MSRSSPRQVAIAGAGVAGRLLAWQLSRSGWQVTVFDPASGPAAPVVGQLQPQAPFAAAFTAAGMLSPLAELDHAEPEIAVLGWRSLDLWEALARELPPGDEALVRREGSLLLAHPSDRGAAQRVLARLASASTGRSGAWPEPRSLDAAALRALEPSLAPGLLGWVLPREGQVLSRQMMEALHAGAPGVEWRWGRTVRDARPGELELDDGAIHRAPLVIDTRGLGARQALPTLRGVRGEVVWLHAPAVTLERPLRLLHPRHRVYVVPRPGGLFVIGASELESEDRSPVSLRSAVELMAAAHSVVPELAEGRIVHLEANLRPALPHHRPHLHHEPGLVQLNGLFRHGWLLAPAMVEKALALIDA